MTPPLSQRPGSTPHVTPHRVFLRGAAFAVQRALARPRLEEGAHGGRVAPGRGQVQRRGAARAAVLRQALGPPRDQPGGHLVK